MLLNKAVFAVSPVSCPILIWFINWNKGSMTVALKIPIYTSNLILKILSHILLDLGYNIQLLEIDLTMDSIVFNDNRYNAESLMIN